MMWRVDGQGEHSGPSSILAYTKVLKKNIGNLIKVHNQINKSFVDGLRRRDDKATA